MNMKMTKPGKKQLVKSPKKQSKLEFKRRMNPNIFILILFSLILVLVSVIRLRLLSFPLERDEGEYAYFGQLILDGVPPYKMAYNLKFPGTYYCYALMMAVFGQTTEGIRIGLLLFNLGSLVFIFLIIKKLFNAFPALIASLSAGLLFVSPSILGQAAHATHFVTFFMLGGTWLLLLAFEKNSILHFIFSGVMMGLAILMKQSGVFFPLFGGLMILLHYLVVKPRKIEKSLTHLCVYGAGVIIPVALIFLIMFWSGVFDKFWFWTITYTKAYGSKIPVSEAFDAFKRSIPGITSAFKYLWITAALGFIALFISKDKLWNRLFIIVFAVFSFLPVIPGFYFRPHYFIPFLPAVGILTGIFFNFLSTVVEKYFKQVRFFTAALFIILVVNGLNATKDFFFVKNPTELCSNLYRGNFFTESIPVAKFIQENTSEEDSIFVCGSEPQIYFYSQRKSATSYIYMYDLVYNHQYVKEMQAEMMQQIEKAHPKYIVFVSCPFSWLKKPKISDTVFSWINKYMIDNKYTLNGVVDYLFPKPSVYSWNNDARNYRKQSKKYMLVLKRPD
jgi:hypothetical protein